MKQLFNFLAQCAHITCRNVRDTLQIRQSARCRSNNRHAARDGFAQAARSVFNVRGQNNQRGVGEPIICAASMFDRNSAPKIFAFELRPDGDDVQIQRARDFAHFIRAFASDSGRWKDNFRSFIERQLGLIQQIILRQMPIEQRRFCRKQVCDVSVRRDNAARCAQGFGFEQPIVGAKILQRRLAGCF
jgi:hypothetical protein